MTDVAGWLKGQNIPFSASQGVKAAEQLPLELVSSFHRVKDGQVTVIPTANAILIVQLVASQSQPLDEQRPTPFIEQFLPNHRRGDLATREVRELRAAAKIELLGELGGSAQAASADAREAAGSHPRTGLGAGSPPR